ncbi:SMI1/KNR4 family protein [Helicobacter salomonis]|uniref:SMI1/KNR4 family protein n=1 Tax=Helicobacter salomonis TaxID=56878 RepID=UPI000CF14727|nr:SMI1/KNR4 family protein [Helicobacter salomonis]
MATIQNTSVSDWEFVVPLEDSGLETAQAHAHVEFSPEFVEFLRRANNAIPHKRNFSIGTRSYQFKNVLNFNTEGKCLFAFFMETLKEHLGAGQIVFGSDGYGGYFLLDTATNKVHFLDSDTGDKIPLIDFAMFLKKLESL